MNSWYRESNPMYPIIYWSEVIPIPLKTMATLIKFLPNVLCCRYIFLFFKTTWHLDLRSWVSEVQEASMFSSFFTIIIRFAAVCSTMSKTFSVPFTMK